MIRSSKPAKENSDWYQVIGRSSLMACGVFPFEKRVRGQALKIFSWDLMNLCQGDRGAGRSQAKDRRQADWRFRRGKLGDQSRKEDKRPSLWRQKRNDPKRDFFFGGKRFGLICFNARLKLCHSDFIRVEKGTASGCFGRRGGGDTFRRSTTKFENLSRSGLLLDW